MTKKLFGSVASIVRVWNDNMYPHREIFGDEEIFIPAGKSIEMDAEKALQFLGQYSAMKLDADGQQKPESYKKLRIETPPEPEAVAQESLRCNRCGYIARNKNEMDGHVFNSHMEELENKDKAIKSMNNKK